MLESKHTYKVTYENSLVGNVSAHSVWEAIEIVFYSYISDYPFLERNKFRAKRLQ